MKLIFIGYHRKVWSLDKPWESQIFPRTTKAQWTASKMVFEVARLWLYFTTHLEKNKYKSRYFIQKELSEHKRQQQRYKNVQE